MNPLDDTLNADVTLPRPEKAPGPPTDRPLDDDLASLATIRQPGVGSLVFGRYRLERVLGRGGMGVVWLAMDTKLDRSVALKFLPGIVGADPAAIQELTEETRRGLELAHPNIVRIYDLVNDDSTAAISMEFVDGKNLSERRLLRPNGVFTTGDVSPWLGPLCGALDYAHLHKRIVHRDLKPANLMLDAKNALKITDFGIARSINDAVSRLSRTNTASNSGTLPYMSPQQVMGDLPRPTDDVYSLGATLYELFTGKPPFHSGDISLQITSKIPPSIRQRRDELCISANDAIPAEWEQTVAACLDKDPTKRPQTAGEVAQRLGLATSLTEPTAPMKAKTSSLRPIEVSTRVPVVKNKKSPVLAIMLGLLAVLVLFAVVATGALWWWFHRPGSWVVQTEPAGAHVTMDGHTCVAPATLPHLAPGVHKATVTLDGYETREVEFEVPPGQQVDFGVMKLERSAGQLLLSSDPDGATYEVAAADGTVGPKHKGKTPDTLRLPVGRYSVTMKHGEDLKTTDVTVARNETARQSFAFTNTGAPSPTPLVAAAAATSADEAHSAVSGALDAAAARASEAPASLGIAPRGTPGASDAPSTDLPTSVPAPNPNEPLVTVRAFGPATMSAGSPAAGQGPTNSGPTPPPPADGFEPAPTSASNPATPSASPAAPAPQPTAPPVGTTQSRGSGSTNFSFAGGGQGTDPTPTSPAAPAPAPSTGPSAPGPPPSPDATPAAPGAPGAPGSAPPAGVAAQPIPQPAVTPPSAGYWTLDEIFANSEYSGYSNSGRKYLVYKAQQAMNESADGVPGKGTYRAIQKYQTEHTLQPTGQLDSATLAAMSLNGQPDRADWGGSRRSSDDDDERTPDSEKTKFRKYIERNVLGGRDLRDVFRR